MDSETLFQKLIDYPFDQKRELKKLFSLLDPELHKQTINYLNFMNHETRIRIEKSITALTKQNSYHVYIHAQGQEFQMLHEICDIEYGQEHQGREGDYPTCGSHMETCDTWNREGANILIGRFQNSFSTVNFTNKKLFLGVNAASLKANPKYISQDFLFNYLHEYMEKIYACTRNCLYIIDEEKFNSVKVQIPSLEKQKEILQLIKNNKEIINNLEQKLLQNEQEVQRFIFESIISLQRK